MRWRALIYTVPLRLRTLFRRARVERDLDDELRFHVECQTRELIAQGLAPAAARRAALRACRGIERQKEQCREVRRLDWVHDLVQDLRYGLRMLRQRPVFTTVAVLTLALGIGANTAIFSVVNAILLRPLPYPRPERLFTLASNESLPDVLDLQRLTARSFSVIGAYNLESLAYTGEAEPVEVHAAECVAELFPVLGATPLLGRPISREDDRYGAPRVAVLTYGFWRQHFAGDASVLGKRIPLSGDDYTVIGVLPAAFWKPGRPVDVLVPLRVAYPAAARERGVHFMETFLRTRPGVSAARAQADLDGASRWLAAHYPEHESEDPRRLVPLRESVVGNVRPALLILFGAVVLVLLIACVNFASLLLARAASRQKELLTRKALGAAAGRLLRQMLAESVPLVLCGGLAGLLLAWWGVQLLVALKPADLPRLAAVRIDGAVLVFTFGICALTTVVFGSLPALGAARIDLARGLQAAGRGTVGAVTFRLRMALVVAEVALALVLLVGAGLLFRSFRHLAQVASGYRAEHLLTLRLELPEARYRGLEPQRRFRQRLLDAVNALPGAQAAMISELPMSGDYLTHSFVIAGRPPVAAGSEPELQTRSVAGAYFRTMQIPLLRGRDFAAEDHAGSRHVAIVNQAFARQYFPKQEPIGARIAWARERPFDWMTIVGVAADVRHFGPARPERPAAYDLYSQTAEAWKRWMVLVVRSRIAPASLVAAVDRCIGSLDKQIPPTEIKTMTEVEAAAAARPRFNLLLMGIFAALALALAAIGIYGVIAYAVTQRTQEIGVRIALGARRRDVMELVLGRCALLTLGGAALGVLAAAALTRLMASLLFGVTARDPATFAAVAALLVAVALLAGFVPARRATRIDPVAALRTE